jgi:hypothetical protein
LKQSTKEENFMTYVQAHERAWGNTSYTGRPDLVQILQSPVVVFWKSVDPKKENQPPTITLHDNLQDLEQHFSKIILRSAAGYPDETVARMYENQKRVIVKGLRVVFGLVEE